MNVLALYILFHLYSKNWCITTCNLYTEYEDQGKCYPCKRINDSATDACLTCEMYPSEVTKVRKCLTCAEKYILNPDSEGCLPCREDCESCIFDSTIRKEICLRCSANLLIRNDGVCISKCDGENVRLSFKKDGSDYCLPCSNYIKNCKTCSQTGEDSPICISCNNNYFYSKSKNACLETCQPNEASIADPYKLCTLCEQLIGNCLECSNEKSCLKCMENFRVSSNGCERCSSHLCKRCDNSIDKCSECKTGYFLIPETKECALCIDIISDCLQCKENELVCLRCKGPKLIRTAGGNCVNGCNEEEFQEGDLATDGGMCTLCSSIITNCRKCSSRSECQTCYEGYYLEPDKKLCVGKCSKGLYGENGLCLECKIKVPNCISCEVKPALKCLNCADGFKLTKAGVCEPCKTNCLQCLLDGEIEKCSLCKPGLFLSSDYLNCFETCKDEERANIQNNKCEVCKEVLPNCKTCNQTGCIRCLKDLYLDETNSCKDLCPADAYFTTSPGSFSSGHCRVCAESIPYCDKCQRDGKACLHCLSGYISRDQGLTCKPCIQKGCSNCELTESGEICQKCANQDRNTNANCQLCSEDGRACKKCRAGYIINNGECKICSESLSNCQQCEQTFFGKVSCILCKKGFYLDLNSEICTPCEENCEICTHEMCFKCKDDLGPTYVDMNQPKKCNDCKRLNNVIIKTRLQEQEIFGCLALPEVNKNKDQFPNFSEVNNLTVAVFTDLCRDPININETSSMKIYWVAGRKKAKLENVDSKDIVFRWRENKGKLNTPSYNDSEGRFWNRGEGNRIEVPGMAGQDCYVKFFCENSFGVIGLEAGSLHFKMPSNEEKNTVFLMKFSNEKNKPTAELKSDVLCYFEGLWNIQGLGLLSDGEGNECLGKRSRFLEESPGPSTLLIVIQLLPDPYSTLNNSMSKMVEVMVNKSNFVDLVNQQLSDYKLESYEMIKSTSDTQIYRTDLPETVAKTPAFLTTQFFPISRGNNLINISLKLVNVDGLVWVQLMPNHTLSEAPKTVAGMGLSNSSLVYLVPKGKEANITFNGISKSEDYYLFFGAQDIITRGYSRLYKKPIKASSFLILKVENFHFYIFPFLLLILYFHA